MIIEAWKPFYAGGQVHAWELCKRLVQNHNCTITMYTRRLLVNNKKYKKNESYFNNKLKIIRCGILTDYESILGRISWVLDVFFKNLFKKYDLIHGQANLGGLPTWLLGFFKKSKTIFTVHGSGLLVWDEMAKGFGQKINYLVERFLQTQIRYDKEISVDSKFCKFKNKNNPIVIPNGVDVEKFDEIKVQKEKKYFKILFVGRLHPQKGLKYLIEAIKGIKDKIKIPFKVVIIGSGQLDQKLKTIVKKYHLEDYFEFKGKVFGEDLIKEYKSSHLFVLPSVFEGQPLTLLEAWAAKLPVIVTDVGGNKDFVENGKNGWIINSKNSEVLADILIKTIKLDNDKLEKIGKKGYELVKTKYCWDNIINKTYKVYSSLKKGEM